jgi:hypothetical protein
MEILGFGKADSHRPNGCGLAGFGLGSFLVVVEVPMTAAPTSAAVMKSVVTLKP